MRAHATSIYIRMSVRASQQLIVTPPAHTHHTTVHLLSLDMADFSHLQNVNSMLRPNAANEEPAQQEEELIAGFDSIANEEGDGNSDDDFPGFGTADEGLSAEQSSSESTVDLKTENTNLKSTIARLTARVAELEAEQAAYTSAGAINRDRAKSFADRNTHDDAAVLHEKIVAFIPLAEAPGPAAILKGGIESGVQAAFAEAPSNRSARAAMDLFTKEYCAALKVEVKVRLSDAFTATQTITACLVVIRLGNNMFSTIYAAVYKGIKNNEHKMFPRYKGAMKKLLAKSGKRAIQQTGDVVDLIVGAINAKPAFDRAVHELVKRCNTSGVRGLKLEISLLTKDASRVGEKVILRPGDACGDASNVTDVVRGMIIVSNMGDVAVVLQCILEMVKEGLIVVNRTKDRFTSPSAGGWRDDLINFTAVEDGVNGGHIGEVQIAHAQLVNARAGLPGHVIYGRVRNSMELVIVAFGKKEVALKILKALEQFAKDVGEDAAMEQAEAKVASFAGACVASEALGEEGVVADAKQIVGLFAIGASVNKKVTLETVEVVGVKMAAIVGSLHVLKGLASRIDDPAVMVEMTKELVDYAARAIKHTVVNGKVSSSKVQADCSIIETNLKAGKLFIVRNTHLSRVTLVAIIC